MKAELAIINAELNMHKSNNVNNSNFNIPNCPSTPRINRLNELDQNVVNASKNQDDIITAETRSKKQKILRVITTSGVSHDQKSVLRKACYTLKNGVFENDINTETTHLVADIDENMATSRTMKYFEAVARGLWIVSPQCINLAHRNFIFLSIALIIIFRDYMQP